MPAGTFHKNSPAYDTHTLSTLQRNRERGGESGREREREREGEN